MWRIGAIAGCFVVFVLVIILINPFEVKRPGASKGLNCTFSSLRPLLKTAASYPRVMVHMFVVLFRGNSTKANTAEPQSKHR